MCVSLFAYYACSTLISENFTQMQQKRKLIKCNKIEKSIFDM